MVEAQGNPYEKMSPQELNTQLKEVYAQIPKEPPERSLEESRPSVVSGGEGAYERIMRRINSEHLERLRKIHADLIDRSRISPYFKLLVNYKFGVHYAIGDDLESPEPPNSRQKFTPKDLLDLANPESGGIFYPERAKEIERKAFQAEFSHGDPNEGRISDLVGIELPEELRQAEGEHRGEWVESFLEKHKELP